MIDCSIYDWLSLYPFIRPGTVDIENVFSIIKTGSGTFLNEFGIMENIPTEAIYLWAAILLVPAFIPLSFAARDYHRRVGEKAAVKAI
jgi:hypothetical protein